MAKRRTRKLTRQQEKAMFAKRISVGVKEIYAYPPRSYGIKNPKKVLYGLRISLLVKERSGKREIGRLDLGLGHNKRLGNLLHVQDVDIDRSYRGKRLGSALYIHGLREAKKRGFVGISSHPINRNPKTSGRVWKALRGTKGKVSKHYDPWDAKRNEYVSGTDIVRSIRPHAKARGKKKRKLLNNAFKMLAKD